MAGPARVGRANTPRAARVGMNRVGVQDRKLRHADAHRAHERTGRVEELVRPVADVADHGRAVGQNGQRHRSIELAGTLSGGAELVHELAGGAVHQDPDVGPAAGRAARSVE